MGARESQLVVGKMKLGLDISNHEPGAYDFGLLADREFVICAIKATQGTYKQNEVYWKQLSGALPHMISGAYNYFDPDLKQAGVVKEQFDFFMWYAFMFDIKPQFLVLDVEREYEWVYEKPKKKKQVGQWVQKTLPADVLYSRVADMLSHFKKSGFPYLVYTRVSWIREFCPKLMKLFENEPLWLAQYPDKVVRHNLPLDEEDRWLKSIEAQAKNIDTGGLKHVLLWQFSEHYKCEGMQDDTDLNTVLDERRFYEWAAEIAHEEIPIPVGWWEGLSLEKRVQRLCEAHPEL